MPATYRVLDETKIIDTLERLRKRIGERFPGSGLEDVAGELMTVSREISVCASYIRSPNRPLRIGTGLAVGGQQHGMVTLDELVAAAQQ